MERLRQRGLDDVLVVLGGIIPESDRPLLKEQGVGEVFGPGASLAQIAEYIRGEVDRRRQEPAGR